MPVYPCIESRPREAQSIPESISIYLYHFIPFSSLFFHLRSGGFLGVLIVYSSNYKTIQNPSGFPWLFNSFRLFQKRNKGNAWKCSLRFHLPTVVLSHFSNWWSFWCQRSCTPKSIPRILKDNQPAWLQKIEAPYGHTWPYNIILYPIYTHFIPFIP